MKTNKTNENEWAITPKKFRDKRTGETVTSFLLTDIKYMEEVK